MGILSPFVIGFGMAFLLYGPCNKIEGLFRRSGKPIMHKLARPVSVVIVYLLLFGLLTLIGYLALPALYHAIMTSSRRCRDIITTSWHSWPNIPRRAACWKIDLEERIKDIYTWISSQLTADRIFSYFQGILNFTTSLLDIFMALIISVYMLLGRESLIRAVKAVAGLVIKPRGMTFCSIYAHKITKIFYSYFYSQAIDACIVGVLATIGLLIARLPNAPVLGHDARHHEHDPLFRGDHRRGDLRAGGAALRQHLRSGFRRDLHSCHAADRRQHHPTPGCQQFVGIKAIYVLLAITIGGGFFGFWGIFLGVPFMAMVQMLVKDFIEYRKRQEEQRISAGTASGNGIPPEENGE